MPNDYFARVTLPYERLDRMVSAWACKCDKILVYQHEGEKTQKIHCHILIMGCSVISKQLKNIASSLNVNLVGNENSSFKSVGSSGQDELNCIMYMSKGVLEPKYNKGYTPELIAQQKARWVEYTPSEKVPKILDFYLNFENFSAQDMFECSHENKFNMLRRLAQQYAFKNNQQLATGKFFTEYKMLVFTYAMRHNISVPSGTKWKEWL